MVFANLIARLPAPRLEAKKVLVLAHREELLAQAQRQIQRYAPHLRVSIERAKQWSDHEQDDVIVASVPTLGRRDSNARLGRFDRNQFKAIIIDEAHHSVAASYLRIMRHFGVNVEIESGAEVELDDGVVTENRSKEDKDSTEALSTASDSSVAVQGDNSDLLVWGCSATLSRHDERALGSLFDKIVYHLDIGHLMREGWLCPAETREIYTDVDLRAVRMTRGDFDLRQLSLAIDTPTRNELIVAMWDQIAREQYGRKATIVFALTVAHAHHLASGFASIGVTTALITGETADGTRQQILADFMGGRVSVIINCAVLTEGTDLPITDCIVMTRPTCNSNLYTQMVGRGLRKHEGKDFCLVLDFVDSLRSKTRSLITFPSLLAARQPPTPSDGEGDRHVAERVPPDDINAAKVSIKVRSGNALELQVVSSPGHGLAWIALDDSHFALSARGSVILLELDPSNRTQGRLHRVVERRDHYRRIHYDATPLSGTSFAAVHSIIPPLIEDLDGCGLLSHVRVDSYWRRLRPMSKGQRAYLGGILARIPGIDSVAFAAIHGWSAGRVSDVIAKYYLRHRFLRKPIKSFEDLIAGVEHYL